MPNINNTKIQYTYHTKQQHNAINTTYKKGTMQQPHYKQPQYNTTTQY